MSGEVSYFNFIFVYYNLFIYILLNIYLKIYYVIADYKIYSNLINGVFKIYKLYIVYKNKDRYKIDQKGPQWAPSVALTMITDADCPDFYFLLLYLHG